ncbi:MAG TPA: NADPH-dependent FMN reductase [Rhodanobacteraceae bacterium]|jgi:NAD(P)H-dependent FMN reductase|nr:NADPH-dependent FMN reductase [Rhodanobacteraceae bacterium]
MKILALCGSLRARSFSAGLLRAARTLAPDGVDFRLFDGHGQLPLFNPDLEADAPAAVLSLWNAVTWADAIIIASPEYAHGVTGTMKNTLDWLVGHIPFAYKPVAVFNPSYQSHHADEALKETLRTMAADLIADACVRIPVIGSRVDADAIAESGQFAPAIRSALQAVVDHVRRRNAGPCDPTA